MWISPLFPGNLGFGVVQLTGALVPRPFSYSDAKTQSWSSGPSRFPVYFGFFFLFFFLCVCFKYSLFTFPPSICVFFFFYFGCARSSNLVAFSFFICVSHFVNPVLFFMSSFFSFHPFFCVVLFYWRLPFFFFFASSSFYLRFLFCLRLIEPSGPPWIY